jgi:2-hydroxychromene-2-carboxylate isomerase
MTRTADWYFDFISPFAYLQFKHFDRLPATLTVRLQPVLFAGLLGHWQHKGPAEIPAKRVQTYRYCHWYAERLGVPFRMPPAHPFNPLNILRLAIALDATPAAVGTIFDFLWGEGGDVNSASGMAELTQRLGQDDLQALVAQDHVKTALRANTERAIAAGVYGVPTFALDNELFWGFDLTDMFLEFLQQPELLEAPEMQRLANMPTAAERRV